MTAAMAFTRPAAARRRATFCTATAAPYSRTARLLLRPFSPSDMTVGPVYEFSVWHVMECDHPLEAVHMEMEAL